MGKDPLKQAEEAKKLGPTIYELYEAWEKWAREQGKIRETVRTMLCCLRQSINVDTKRTRSLTHADLENFKHARLKAGLKPSTINRTIRELRYLYKWGVETGNLPDDCTFPDVAALSESQLSPKVHYLSDVDVKKLLDIMDDMIRQRPEKSYLRDIILFALNTGIRPASICGLERRDVLRARRAEEGRKPSDIGSRKRDTRQADDAVYGCFAYREGVHDLYAAIYL